jgi:hypothetical protein
VSQLRIETSDGRTCFAPGELLEAVAEWTLDVPADAVALRLLWNTRHSGDENTSIRFEDRGIIDQERYLTPETSGRRHWPVQLPNGPYSFCGTLFSLVWALELVVEPGNNSCRFDITVAPHGKDIILNAQGRPLEID